MNCDYGGQPCYNMGCEAQLGGERGIARDSIGRGAWILMFSFRTLRGVRWREWQNG